MAAHIHCRRNGLAKYKISYLVIHSITQGVVASYLAMQDDYDMAEGCYDGVYQELRPPAGSLMVLPHPIPGKVK